MIARNKFIHLNIKQKIYKLASTIRSYEQKLKADKPIDYTMLTSYLEYVQPDREIKRMAKALVIIDSYLKDFETIEHNREKVKALNFCFHDLLVLINEGVGEKFYDVQQFDASHAPTRFPTAAILDNIRSPFNVGSFFRTADSFGVGSLGLCGITPHPPSIKIDRTAMGTIEVMDWGYYPTTIEAIAHYRDAGYTIYALETVSGAVTLGDVGDFDHACFVFGNEEFGITEEILSLCDGIVRIPLVGKKNSINVANCFAVIMYEVMNSFINS